MSATRVAREILGMIIVVGVLIALSLLHERTASAQFRQFLKAENASDKRIEDSLDDILYGKDFVRIRHDVNHEGCK